MYYVKIDYVDFETKGPLSSKTPNLSVFSPLSPTNRNFYRRLTLSLQPSYSTGLLHRTTNAWITRRRPSFLL